MVTPLIALENRGQAMGLFKADFYRFFTLGFAVGALLVVANVGLEGFGSNLADGVVPVARAATAS